MAVRNDLYDPDSDAIHDRNSVERERLSRLLYGAGRSELPKEQHAAVKAAFDHHHLVCLRTFMTCHETVEGYARWLFGMGTWPSGRVTPRSGRFASIHACWAERNPSTFVVVRLSSSAGANRSSM